MRSGVEEETFRYGGEWETAADARLSGGVASIEGADKIGAPPAANGAPRAPSVFTNGLCIEAMVLQQSCV